jgi:putative cell wall-binding protein
MGERAVGVRAPRVVPRILSVVAAVAVAASLTLVAFEAAPDAASAAVGSAFDAGYIISDSQFYDGNAMTAAQVQAFLNARVPTCQSGPCLKDYQLSYPAKAADSQCSAISAGTGSAAQVIALVGQACGISQKVLLVLMQKEQSLVTATAPSDRQYRSATGYGCPDTSACDSLFYGLFNQLYKAAWQFERYRVAPGNFNNRAGTTREIRYSPNSACGTKSVYIENAATAGLYNYTPYTPNSAALANLYGTGDSCSSYGNRNFWRIFSDWFGSPTDVIPQNVAVTRVGGADRYASSAAISASYFAAGVPVVYLASGLGFADAISAAPAAAKGGGPVLLTSPNSLPDAVRAELVRLAPQRIVAVGGTASISDELLATLSQFSPDVQRIFGQDRYATSRALLSDAFGATVPELYIATGEMFADALSASAAAGSKGVPVLLVAGSDAQLDAATADLISSLGTTKVYIAGGTGVVSGGLEQSLVTSLGPGSTTRLAGSNRYATSSAVNLERFATATTFYVASGDDYPDALGAAPIAAIKNAPLYVTPAGCMPRALAEHIVSAGATTMVIVGGTGAVGGAVATFRNC